MQAKLPPLMCLQQDITWTVSGRVASWHPLPRTERPWHVGWCKPWSAVCARLWLELARLRAELVRQPQGQVILSGHLAQTRVPNAGQGGLGCVGLFGVVKETLVSTSATLSTCRRRRGSSKASSF